MHVELSKDKKELIIRLPVEEKESVSKKSLLVATTGGNKQTDIEYKGKKLVVAVNCYIPANK